MKNIWANVIKESTIQYGYDKILKKEELLKQFEYYINCGGWRFIKWSQRKKYPYQCVINNGKHNIDALLYQSS